MKLAAALFFTAPKPRSAFLGDALAVFVMWTIACGAGGLLMQYRQATQLWHPKITLEEMRHHVETKDVLILDARDGAAFALGHLPSAVNLPMNEWKSRPATMNALLREHRDRLIIVYCTNQWCGQADDLQQALIDLGHIRVGLFSAGIETWLGAGLPVDAIQ